MVSIIVISVNEIKNQSGRKSLYPSAQEMMPLIFLMKMLEYFILKNGSENQAWGHYFFHFHFIKNKKNNPAFKNQIPVPWQFTVIMIKLTSLALLLKQNKKKWNRMLSLTTVT